MAIRLVVTDDHPIVLRGLEQLLARQDDLSVIASCTTAAETTAAVRTLQPDVLVLDLRMPGRDGLGVLGEVATTCRTVLLTAAISDEQVVEAVNLGAAGLVLKESAADALLSCIRRVHRGDICIDREVVTRALQSALQQQDRARQIAEVLTAREGEIVQLVAQGRRNRAIADGLGISEGTVKVHLHNIYDKLGVEGRLELVVLAQRRGFI